MIANYCQTLTGSFDLSGVLATGSGSWMGLVLLGLTVSALGLAIVYALSQLLRLPKLEAWTKFELFQLLLTAVLAVLLAGWVMGMCHWDASVLSPQLYNVAGGRQAIVDACNGAVNGQNYTGGVNQVGLNGAPIITPYCAAQYYLQKVKVRGDDVFQMLITLNYGFSYLFKSVWESRPMGIGYTLEPLAGFQQLQNLFLVAVSGFMVSYLSVLIQMRVLDFMLLAVPYFFLPLGLLLRAFPPSREFGGALVGFAIASLFFYPLILVMNDLVIFSSLDTATAPAVEFNGNMTALAAQSNVPLAGGTFDISKHPLGDIEQGQTVPPGGGAIIGTDGKPLTVANAPASTGDNAIEFLGSDGQSYRINVTAGSQTADTYRLFSAINPLEEGTQINALAGNSSDVAGLGANLTGGTPAAPGVLQKMDDLLFGVMNIVLIYFVAAIMLPIINFLVYIETARSLTKFLGAEMDLSNLSRLI